MPEGYFELDEDVPRELLEKTYEEYLWDSNSED